MSDKYVIYYLQTRACVVEWPGQCHFLLCRWQSLKQSVWTDDRVTGVDRDISTSVPLELFAKTLETGNILQQVTTNYLKWSHAEMLWWGSLEAKYFILGRLCITLPYLAFLTGHWYFFCRIWWFCRIWLCLPYECISRMDDSAVFGFDRAYRRPTWRDRFSNPNQAPFPGPWNHAEVKATSQIAPRVVQKAPLLICSGKFLICVCEGVVLCDLI